MLTCRHSDSNIKRIHTSTSRPFGVLRDRPPAKREMTGRAYNVLDGLGEALLTLARKHSTSQQWAAWLKVDVYHTIDRYHTVSEQTTRGQNARACVPTSSE